MAKKSFTFPAAKGTDPGHVSQTGREVLRKTHDDGVVAMDNAKLVRVDRIVPDPRQPRKTIDPAYLSRLAESIRLHGILMPLTVKYRIEDETFLLIAGEQRWRAAQQAGLAEVPVVVRNSDTTERYVQSCMENLLRADLTEIEKGEALEELKRLLPQTWEQMARMLGLTRRRVDQMRQLTAVRPALQDALRAKSISGRHARQLDLLPEELQESALAAVVDAGLTVRQVEEVVRRLRQDTVASPAVPDPSSASDVPSAATRVPPQEPLPPSPDGVTRLSSGDGQPGATHAADPATPRVPAAQVAEVISAVLAEQGTAPRQRHSVPVATKLTMIEKSLRGIPLHSVGDTDRAEVIARLRRITDVLAQMERVLS